MKEKRFDKTIYAEKTFKEADNNVAFWRSRPWWERLQAGYHLSLRAYGYDPDGPEPKMDLTFYEERKFED